MAWLAAWQRRAVPQARPGGGAGVRGQPRRDRPRRLALPGGGDGAGWLPTSRPAGAAINQLARIAGATLRVVPLELDRATADMVAQPAMTEAEFASAVAAGVAAVQPGTDLLCLGEMGIGNTTAAAAAVHRTVRRGGLDRARHRHRRCRAGPEKRDAVLAATQRHAGQPPLEVARCLGGRELAAIAGAVMAARHAGIPVLLDGFVCTAAAAPLAVAWPGALDHCLSAHCSAEAAHRRLLDALGLPAAARPRDAAGRRLRCGVGPCRSCGRRWPATPAWPRSRTAAVTDRAP